MIRGKKIIKYIKLSRLRHKEKLSKFKEFKINYGYISKNAMELNILNNEGTFQELSWLTCVPGKLNQSNQLLRESVKDQIFALKQKVDM